MQVSRAVREAMIALLAADVGTFAAVAALKVHLVIAPFVASLDVGVLGDYEIATFTGGAPKAAGIGSAQVYDDPATGARCLQLLEPAGGWTWICSVTPGAPETVYGYVVTNQAGTVVLGSHNLPTPITVSAAFHAVIVDAVRCAFPGSFPS